VPAQYQHSEIFTACGIAATDQRTQNSLAGGPTNDYAGRSLPPDKTLARALPDQHKQLAAQYWVTNCAAWLEVRLEK